ncbi:MAG: TonB-dependent receptor [Alcanivorax sp.]|jgi:TonB-dependent receptor
MKATIANPILSTENPSPRMPFKPQLKKLTLALGLAVATMGAANSYAENITGEVTDTRKSAVFEGALIKLEELNVSTTSDSRGRFRLSNVPPGSYTLTVNYVGAETRSIAITVGEGDLAMGEVVLGTVGADGEFILEEILVTGQAAAMAGAINQQRAADNIKSVLDADSMGQFPDQNVAESLRRLSGISVENDQGEGRYVVIRGMDPDLNSTSINGVRSASAESRRALQLDVIPSDVLDGIEVQKSLTPDMDGDAIGGSINVKTLSAFNRKGLFVKGRVEEGYNDLREEWSPKASVAASNIFELENGRRLGVAGALSWQDRKLQADNNEADGWEVADNGSQYVEEFEPRHYTIDRERIGAVLNLDYDFSDHTTLTMRSLYSKFEDSELRTAQTYGDLELLTDDSVTNTLADYGLAEIEMSTKDRVQTAETLSIVFGTESQWDVWNVDSKIGYSYGQEEDPDLVESAWKAEFESGEDGIAADTPVLSLNTSDIQQPRVESQYFNLLRDQSRYELDEITDESAKIEDTQWSFQIDATREFERFEVQFGAKARLREKTSDEDVLVYEGDGSITMQGYDDLRSTGDYSFPNVIQPAPSASGVRSILASGDGLEFDALGSEIDSTVNDWEVEEDIFAGYGLVRYYTEKMVIIGGIRVEYTDFSSSGNFVELIETDDDEFVQSTSVNADRGYTDVLPSVNVRYDFTEKLVGRAAVSKSLVRPLFEDVAARIAVDDGEAEIGNTDLDPYGSWNYDLSLEFYPSQLSVLSVGMFYKDLSDFIYYQTFDDFEFNGVVYDEATIANNGEDAEVFGLEFNYQQHFGFLPEPFDGLLVSLNYTYVDSEAQLEDRKISMPKQANNIAGFVIGYEKYGLDLRLAMKYRDKYLDSIEGEDEDRFTDSHTQWDFTAKYSVSENWLVYAELANINEEPEYYYSGNRNRLLQYDEFGTTGVIGVQFIY